ncbi:flavin reductase family protein [Streptomyces plumbiresistens]|uniref:Flavin reductase like domain-containing protein n=1 Tax=Streptomyces plumbiresistens TaxID=511811 RepID=A0ABP7TGG7_9ACTN
MDNEVTPLVVAGQQDLRTSFRDVVAALRTPVSAVTTTTDGLPHGTTASISASSAMDPSMVLVPLDRGSALLTLVRETGSFELNVLSIGRSILAVNARKGGTKSAGVPWDVEAGVPRLPGTYGFLACDEAEVVTGGDDVVLLGRVRLADPTGGRPLTHDSRAALNRRWKGRWRDARVPGPSHRHGRGHPPPAPSSACTGRLHLGDNLHLDGGSYIGLV